jgi:tellurite resistance protein TerC
LRRITAQTTVINRFLRCHRDTASQPISNLTLASTVLKTSAKGPEFAEVTSANEYYVVMAVSGGPAQWPSKLSDGRSCHRYRGCQFALSSAHSRKLIDSPIDSSGRAIQVLLGTSIYTWATFIAVIVAAITIDLGVFHRKTGRITFRKALAESAAWVSLALLFNLWIYVSLGHQAGLEFFASYLVEKSLSIDNIFLFVLIFQALRTPAESQHGVLYSGVIGALLMRGLFVFAGITLLRHFHFVIFIFGAVLLVTGVRMLATKTRTVKPERNWLVRLTRRLLRVTNDYRGGSLFIKQGGRWNATPLLVALVAIEAADIIFAIDSVPAVLAITRDSFIAYSSNVFAILGLRAMYFALADILPRYRFVNPALAAILIFVGTKMILADRIPISVGASLCVIAAILLLAVSASLLWPKTSRT